MDYNRPNRNLSDTEMLYLKKISDLINKAKDNNRYDIVEAADLSNIENQTQLKSRYAKLLDMEKTPLPDAQSTASEKSTTEPKPASQQSSPGLDKTIAIDPMLQGTPIERGYTQSAPENASEEEIPAPPTSNQQGQPGQQSAPEDGQTPPPDQQYYGGQNSAGGQDPSGQNQNQSQGAAQAPGSGDPGGNPPDEDKARSAAMLSKVLVSTYAEYIPKMFTGITKVSENTVMKLEQSGEINFANTINVPFPTPRITTMGEYIADCNAEADKAFVVDDEFKADLTTALTAYMKSKDWGLKPGEVVLVMLAKHLGNCTTTCLEMKKMFKDNLELFAQITKQEKEKTKPSQEAFVSNLSDMEKENDHFDHAEVIGENR